MGEGLPTSPRDSSLNDECMTHSQSPFFESENNQEIIIFIKKSMGNLANLIIKSTLYLLQSE